MAKLALPPVRRKWLGCIAAALIGLMAVTPALDAILDRLYIGKLDDAGRRYYDEALERSLYTYAVVRGINGIISVVQGTVVAAAPAGIGLSVAAGEILDPVNDLVERFSWVMLIATVALGIQKLLLDVGLWFGFSCILPLAMLLVIIGIWRNTPRGERIRAVGLRLVLIAMVIRFGIPVMALASDKVYLLFLEKPYAEATQSLEAINTEIRETSLEPADGAPDDTSMSWWDRLESLFNGSEGMATIKERLTLLQEKIAGYAEHTLVLAAVFLLQTVVIPIMVLWGLIRIVGIRWVPTWKTATSVSESVPGGKWMS